MLDPLYAEIVRRLNGELDPTTFQRCADSLLMAEFPGLAPMAGGGDQGFDGAIQDGGREPIPVIATTAKDALGNLRRNLRAVVASGSAQRSAVFATPRRLTNTRQTNLRNAGRLLGFTLSGLYEQLFFAEHLYRDARWRRELLGLTGQPPALSALPASVSAATGRALIGRSREYEALLTLVGDRMLLGQPGSGKSFMLAKAAQEGRALFVVSDARDAIADAIRQRDDIPLLVVDDAHTESQLHLLQMLLQVRNDLGAVFSVCAVSWPGRAADAARDLLAITEPAAIELGPLTIDEIVQLLSEMGLAGPRWLVGEIVHQAAGWPGLAATLATASLFGGLRNVLSGRRLEELVLRHVEHRSTEETRSVLASLALGGDYGMPMALVAAVLNLPLPRTRQLVCDLQVSGVVRESGERLAVYPEQLRWGLIRDTFFSGPTALPHAPLVEATGSVCDTALSLIGAASRGAVIAPDELRDLIRACGQDQVRKAYAWLGPDEAAWCLDDAPGSLLQIAEPALAHVPSLCIPLLLHAAEGDERELHATPSHPLRLIQDWVAEAMPTGGEPVARRQALLDAVLAYAEAGGNPRVCCRILPATLSPRCAGTYAEVSAERRYVLWDGYLTCDEIDLICATWPRAMRLVRILPALEWASLLGMLREWSSPYSLRGELPGAVRDRLQEQARAMLADLAQLAGGEPAVGQRLREIAADLGVRLEIDVEPDFEILFPERTDGDLVDWRAADNRESERVRALAVELWRLGPLPGLERLARAEAQAGVVARKWPRWTPYAAEAIASAAQDPLTWLDSSVALGLAVDIAAPFLHRAVTLDADGWQDRADTLLELPRYRTAVIDAVLRRHDMPEALIERSLTHLEGAAELVKWAIARDTVPLPLLARLLQHPTREVALAAAEGEWARAPRGHVREGIKTEWTAAVISHARDQHWVAEALGDDSTLAGGWLASVLADESVQSWRIEDELRAAVGAVSYEDRVAALSYLEPSFRDVEAAAIIVGDQSGIYEALLCIPRLADLHLVPLRQRPSPTWRAKALLALAHGYTPEDVAAAAVSRGEWRGRESAMYQEWIDDFSPFLTDAEAGIQTVARVAIEQASADLQRAVEQERRAAVYGDF